MSQRNKQLWKEYEQLVCDAFAEENKDVKFHKNVSIQGQKSGTKRQIDVVARKKVLERDLLIVIDCKHYSSKLDVRDVGTFSSLLEDVGADFGIIVTQKGFSKAAEMYALRSRVTLKIKSLSELRHYSVELDFCELCESDYPAVIDWGNAGVGGDISKIAAMGICDRCDGLHIRCLRCGMTTGIYDLNYGSKVNCEGGCGIKFEVRTSHDGDGIPSDDLKVY